MIVFGVFGAASRRGFICNWNCKMVLVIGKRCAVKVLPYTVHFENFLMREALMYLGSSDN